MIPLDALSGCIIRKALNATRVRMSYHNKHKDGSGNFGFVIVFDRGGKKDVGCGMTAPNETWYDLHGDYDNFKQIRCLTFGTYSRPINRIPNDWSRAQLFKYCIQFIEQAEGIHEREQVHFT